MKRLYYLLVMLFLCISLAVPALPARAASVNLLANPSMETATTNAPADWLSNTWGTNTSTFTYETTGRTGNRSLTVTTSAYSNGDAKWFAKPVIITGGKNYTYSDYYKSGVDTRVVAEFVDAAGAYSYTELSPANLSTTWAQYSVDFVAPTSAKQVVIYHLLDKIGSLSIDDASLTEVINTVPVDLENIILNNSFETANGTTPSKWQSSKWGTNTSAFTYEATGRTGNRSATVTTTAYTNGDAKWAFDPVAVTAGKTYMYRDYYKSTVSTRAVAAYINASGTYTYSELAAVPAAPTWTLYETTFVIPAGTTKVTVFHLLDAKGSLTIDDALLQVAIPAVSSIDVPNGSLEEGTTLPSKWQKNSWGSNTAAFTYVSGGRTGAKSVKTTVSNYVDGDAKWYFDPITTLTPGLQYRFTTWYKGTAIPHATAMFTMSDGSVRYSSMPSPLTVSTAWQKYTDTFTVPTGTVSTSAFMFVVSNGWAQTDDYSIADYHPSALKRALVTLTFDDGHEENATNALPILNKYGLKSTQCYATSFIEGKTQKVKNGVLAFSNSGHEICSHTVTHPFLTTLTSIKLDYELKHSKQYLETLTGKPVVNFASPYGDYNATVNAAIAKTYQSHRTVDEGFNSKDNFDAYRLRVQNILDTTNAAQVKAWVDQAKTDNTWLILVYHRIANDPGPYDSTIANFDAHMKAIKISGVTVLTMQAALTELRAQL